MLNIYRAKIYSFEVWELAFLRNMTPGNDHRAPVINLIKAQFKYVIILDIMLGLIQFQQLFILLLTQTVFVTLCTVYCYKRNNFINTHAYFNSLPRVPHAWHGSNSTYINTKFKTLFYEADWWTSS